MRQRAFIEILRYEARGSLESSKDASELLEA